MPRLALVLAVALICSSARAPFCFAQDAKPVQLFNGKDFTGWTAFSKDEGVKLEDVWSVKEGGIIHCKGKPAGYLRTNEDYTNFVLKFEWRTEKKGNSGCLIRMQAPDKVWPKSIEAQLASGAAGDIWIIDEFPIKVDESRRKGRQVVKLAESSEKPFGEWNQYEITADGGKLELKVNGVLQNTGEEMEEIPGKILFQSEGAEIEFRNIELTPLPSKQPKKLLAGLDGWYVTGNGNWTFKDGVIEGKQGKETQSYTHVLSDKTYKNLKASLKFKALKGNSGFYFRVHPDAAGKMHGIQAEIDEKRDAGGLYESYGRQWLAQPKKEDVANYFKPGDWNEMTVEAKGNHVVVHVNGFKASEITDDKQNMEGQCALQIHGGQDVHVMFKDIQIEALPD